MEQEFADLDQTLHDLLQRRAVLAIESLRQAGDDSDTSERMLSLLAQTVSLWTELALGARDEVAALDEAAITHEIEIVIEIVLDGVGLTEADPWRSRLKGYLIDRIVKAAPPTLLLSATGRALYDHIVPRESDQPPPQPFLPNRLPGGWVLTRSDVPAPAPWSVTNDAAIGYYSRRKDGGQRLSMLRIVETNARPDRPIPALLSGNPVQTVMIDGTTVYMSNTIPPGDFVTELMWERQNICFALMPRDGTEFQEGLPIQAILFDRDDALRIVRALFKEQDSLSERT